MSEQQIHEIDFKSDNHFNVYMFTQFLHQQVINPANFKVEHQEWRDRYKVSIGDNLVILVKASFLPEFYLMLEQALYDDNSGHKFNELEGMIDPNGKLWVTPTTVVEESYPTDDSSFWSLTGEDFISVDRRLEGLITASSSTIREIAKLINGEMDAVALNTEIVKDFDGIITFDTKTGKDFAVHLCFDKVPPVSDENEARIIERTPITQADLETYLGKAGEKIQSRLAHINSLVKAMFESKQVTANPALNRYAELAVNVTLVKAFLDQNVNYISFGGRDNWRSEGPETPNNKACFAILDAEVDKLFTLLETIPKQEGVDLYSIDVDTFSIFGRNNDNKVVTPAVQGYTEEILKKYSQGFERVLSTRLKLIDTAHVFSA